MTKPGGAGRKDELQGVREFDAQRAGSGAGSAAGPGRKPKTRLVGILVLALVAVIGVATALVLPRVFAGAAVDLSCLDDRLDGFFDKQSATEGEVEFQGRVADYARRLAGFSCDQGYRLPDLTDPVAGSWMGEEGYFAFTQDTFRWSVVLEGDDSEYSFAGRYAWLPGCEFEEVLELRRGDRPCYTVFLRYEETMSGGTPSGDLYYGGLMVAQEGRQPVDSMSVFNLRTGGSFHLDRLEE